MTELRAAGTILYPSNAMLFMLDASQFKRLTDAVHDVCRELSQDGWQLTAITSEILDSEGIPSGGDIELNLYWKGTRQELPEDRQIFPRFNQLRKAFEERLRSIFGCLPVALRQNLKIPVVSERNQEAVVIDDDQAS